MWATHATSFSRQGMQVARSTGQDRTTQVNVISGQGLPPGGCGDRRGDRICNPVSCGLAASYLWIATHFCKELVACK